MQGRTSQRRDRGQGENQSQDLVSFLSFVAKFKEKCLRFLTRHQKRMKAYVVLLTARGPLLRASYPFPVLKDLQEVGRLSTKQPG